MQLRPLFVFAIIGILLAGAAILVYIQWHSSSESYAPSTSACRRPPLDPVLVATSTLATMSPTRRADAVAGANGLFFLCLPNVWEAIVAGTTTNPVIIIVVSKLPSPAEAQLYPAAIEGVPVEVTLAPDLRSSSSSPLDQMRPVLL